MRQEVLESGNRERESTRREGERKEEEEGNGRWNRTMCPGVTTSNKVSHSWEIS